MIQRLLITILAIALINGCASYSTLDTNFPPKERATNVKKEAIDTLVSGNNTFAWELYTKLVDANTNTNVFFSPSSISTALAMTYVGARGETAQQMAKTLKFDMEAPAIHSAFSKLIDQINDGQNKKQYLLSIANALWGQKDYGFLPEFLNTTGKNYGAGLYEVDFTQDPEQARKAINHWVERKTMDKIKELLQQGTVTRDTALILTNAIYFKGNWVNPFDEKLTQNSPFHLNATAKISVPTMYQKETFRYYEEHDFQILELPYKGKDLAMTIILPKQIDGLLEMENKLSSEKIANIRTQMKAQKVRVYMPKFKMTYDFSVKEALQAMGMIDAFDSQKANFSGMSTRKLSISDVVHKAFVDVNERGTEAAAATAVVGVTSAAPISQPPVFKVDRPFMFSIIDINTNSILFMGRIMNPKSK